MHIKIRTFLTVEQQAYSYLFSRSVTFLSFYYVNQVNYVCCSSVSEYKRPSQDITFISLKVYTV
jgi:hypothetical protein